MSTKFTLLLAAFLLFVVGAQGLDCFNCIYLETQSYNEDITIEDSCAEGKTPLSRLSVDCSTLDDYRVLNTGGAALGIPSIEGSAHNNSKRMTPLPNAVFTCATLTYDGRYNNLHNNLPVKGVLRTCLISYTNQTIAPQCHHDTLETLISTVKQAEVLDLLVDFSDELYEPVTDTGICTCNENNCNVNTEVESKSSGFRVVPRNVWLYSLPLFLAVSKYLLTENC